MPFLHQLLFFLNFSVKSVRWETPQQTCQNPKTMNLQSSLGPPFVMTAHLHISCTNGLTFALFSEGTQNTFKPQNTGVPESTFKTKQSASSSRYFAAHVTDIHCQKFLCKDTEISQQYRLSKTKEFVLSFSNNKLYYLLSGLVQLILVHQLT